MKTEPQKEPVTAQARQKVLTLNAEGPSMAGDGKMAKYKDSDRAQERRPPAADLAPAARRRDLAAVDDGALSA